MTNDAMVILQSVHQFYSDSWSQLVTYTIGLLAFVGALIPIIIQVVQSRTFKAEQISVRKQLSNELSQAKAELADTLKEDYKIEVNRVEKLLDDKISSITKKMEGTKGGVFHVEGSHYKSRGSFAVALLSFVDAAQCYLKAEDELNLQRVLRQIIEDCLPKLDSTHFQELDSYEKEVDGLVSELKGHNQTSRYTDTIAQIQRGIAKAKKRQPPEKKD